jgi:hypothetical protein
MLEGKELETKIGEFGSAFVDVNDSLVLEIGLSAKVDLVAELKKIAAKTSTPVDDVAIAWIEKVLAAKKAMGA